MIHTPVLLENVLEKVNEIKLRNGTFVDATFGRGGHTREILRTREDLKIIALDCDIEALEYGAQHFKSEISSGRLALTHANFLDFDKVVIANDIVGFLLDLGVSSPQLDEGRRGFSFYHDGPLDMRMDTSQELTAADIINNWDEQGLNDLFHNLGEVRSPYRVTKKILDARRQKHFTTTGELAILIERADGWHKKGHHPATNYFLALRLEINQELARLERVLPKIIDALQPSGRLLVITFHSLEDRIVKLAFKKFEEIGRGLVVTKKVIQAEWSEKKSNPRSRSAKLRVFEKSFEKGPEKGIEKGEVV